MVSNQVKSLFRSFVFAGLIVVCPAFVEKVMAGDKLPFDPGAKFSLNRGIVGTHKGYDFVPPGDSYHARASRAGTVFAVGYDSSGGCSISGKPSGFGYRVVIKHQDNTYTIYAHLKANTFKVSLNQSVPQGAQLGIIGNSGCSTGIHLHFQKSDEPYGNRYQTVAFDEQITNWSSIYSQNYGTDIINSGFYQLELKATPPNGVKQCIDVDGTKIGIYPDANRAKVTPCRAIQEQQFRQINDGNGYYRFELKATPPSGVKQCIDVDGTKIGIYPDAPYAKVTPCRAIQEQQFKQVNDGNGYYRFELKATPPSGVKQCIDVDGTKIGIYPDANRVKVGSCRAIQEQQFKMNPQ